MSIWVQCIKAQTVENPVPSDGMENQSDRSEVDQLKRRMIAGLSESEFGYYTLESNRMEVNRLATDLTNPDCGRFS